MTKLMRALADMAMLILVFVGMCAALIGSTLLVAAFLGFILGAPL